MRILDTHLHLIYPDRFSYPWLASKPDIDHPWRVEDYFAEALALGIETAVHMEVDVAPADMMAETDFVLGLPRIVGAVAACRPEAMNFVAHIEQLAERPHVKGVRRILHTEPDGLSQSDLFAENLRHLPDFDLSFDLCVRADQLGLALALAQRAPDVTFILDHCGNPDIAGEAMAPWQAGIAAIAGLPNVHAKLSGIAVNARPGWTTQTMRPYVDFLLERFGPERLVWGSDHPVVTRNGTLRQWVECSRELLGTLTPDEQAAIFHRNAERLYKI